MGESCVDAHVKKSLENHELTKLENTGWMNAYYLHTPGATISYNHNPPRLCGRAQSTLIMETAEGIVICGDVSVKLHGVVSALGYKLPWFGGTLSEDYLCSKFLEKGFHSEHAEAWLKARHAELVAEFKVANFLPGSDERKKHQKKMDGTEEILNSWHCDDAMERVTEALEILGENPEGEGFDYAPSEASWLCAIQQRFSVLYQAHGKPG